MNGWFTIEKIDTQTFIWINKSQYIEVTAMKQITNKEYEEWQKYKAMKELIDSVQWGSFTTANTQFELLREL